MAKGFFIVIEGIDGSGKTSQAEMLADYLERTNLKPELTAEPTHGEYGKPEENYGQLIRARAAERDSLDPNEWVELLEWFTRDRKQHVENLINPLLDCGKVVICDRYLYSTAAYQGAMYEYLKSRKAHDGWPAVLDPQRIFQRQMQEGFPLPDLFLYLDCPVKIALARIRLKRKLVPLFENPAFLPTVRLIFKRQALLFPEGVQFSGLGHEHDVHNKIVSAIEPVIRLWENGLED